MTGMYNYENYTKVKEKIEKRRSDARARADERSALLRSRSPEIAKIDEELSGTGLLLFKTACAGGDVLAIRMRNQELCKRRRLAIAALGYPEDYTDVQYTCKECSDTGFIENGKMCSCFREELIRETIASSGIGKLIEKQSFDNFSLAQFEPGSENYEKMKHVLDTAKEYVENFAKCRGNLLLIGKTGTGKTHISTAIARGVISQGFDVIYDSVQNIISDFEADKFRASYSAEAEKGRKYLECDLLIIDDLGTEFSSQFSISCLYNLLNTRQNRGKATVISTNLGPKELLSFYDDRIYSRITGSQCEVLAFLGKDNRLK